MSRRTWIVFAAVSALWGAPYVLIKIALRDLEPSAVVLTRTAIGAGALLPLAARAGALGPALWRRWRWLFVLAVCEMAAPFTLITSGERHIASSLAGVLVASAPLFTSLLAVWWEPDGRPRGLGLGGLAAGFLGVVITLGVSVSGSAAALLGGGAVLLASLLYAVAGHVLVRRFSDLPATAVMGAVMALAAALMVVPAAAALPAHSPSAGTVAALLGLGLGCTGAAFVGFARLNVELGPSRASVVAYVAPAFAVVLGVTFGGDALRATTVLGLALILVGSFLAAGGSQPVRMADGEAVPLGG